MKFELNANMTPAGDQPKAIESLVNGIKKGLRDQVLLGVTGSGKSVVGSTPVLVKRNGGCELVEIGKIIDQLLNTHNKVVITDNDTELLQHSFLGDLQVQSFDPVTKQCGFKKVTQVTRHKSPNELINIQTTCGRNIKVTSDHNFYVLRNGSLVLVKTNDITPTDSVPIPRSIPGIQKPLKSFKWVDYLPNETCLFTEPTEEVIDASRGTRTGSDIWRMTNIHQRVQLDNNTTRVLESQPESRFGSKLRKYSFLYTQPITDSVLRLIGYYIGEGHSTPGYVTISTGSGVVSEHLFESCEELGLSISKRQNKKFDYQISSKVFSGSIGAMCGKISQEKRLPNFWPNLSNKQLSTLLSAYFSADGGVEHDVVSATTVSSNLANDVLFALLRFGIIGRVATRFVRVPNSTRNSQIWTIKISGKTDLIKFRDEINFSIIEKSQKLEMLLQQNKGENTNVDVVPIDGTRFCELRKELGLYQQTVASLINSSRSYISMLESGKRHPSITIFKKICTLLKMTATQKGEQLLAEEVERIEELGNLFWSPVKTIQKVPGEQFVYDFSVEQNETFLAGFGGIFVHNTFTVANIIKQTQKPTLVIVHNKTLAAQLTSEFRHYFPKNAVEYFVSYYDYYQPEAYMPNSDTYIEKEAQINDEIDRLRHAATQAVLSRPDVIVVASVSCIYGLGSAEEYQKATLALHKDEKIDRDLLIDKLVFLQYQRNDIELSRGDFRVRGEIIEIAPSNSQRTLRISLDGDVINNLQEIDPVTNDVMEEMRFAIVYPTRHFVTPPEHVERALKSIEDELEAQLKRLTSQGKILEADRLKRRTRYDLEMIRQVGYCNGIENYSRHFDGRMPGGTPNTLLDYFPKDFLTIIDESHVTVSQINGMYNGDAARKEMLVEHGFRLPSAKDNRPLRFHEFEKKVNQVIYTSATPGAYELAKSENTVEQIIRPTGLLDPELIIQPLEHQVQDLLERVKGRVEKNERVLVTTLTKKMAEDLAEYMQEQNIKVRYLHSDIETLERVEILRDLRKGLFDVLIGVNLLREGLDLPEVSLVAILDADKEGFLRSERALIQTIGRAARNVQGQVILYADTITDSLKKAIYETNRRRGIQEKYNTEHGITPTTISKEITSIIEREIEDSVGLDKIEKELAKGNIDAMIKDKERQMKIAAQELQFELAAILRDEIARLKKMQKDKKSFTEEDF